MQIHKRTAVVA